MDHIAVIDFEASSLDGWPVEVGLAWCDGGQVRVWSSLIRPEPDWDMALWDMQAEEIHGITRAQLDDAPDVAQVAAALMGHIGARGLVSDAPGFDQFWLDQLLRAAGAGATPRIEDFHLHAFEHFDRDLARWRQMQDDLEQGDIRHRAGADAERLLRALTG
ncbi:MAG: hypothetical protein Q4G14_12940 [Paracoccus sp. (in: a-proteobacteria)]|uniref:3'-5' exonuclease n=1 Tax=Paracoccus sp. TaxID=267 RepID=UPI0026DF86B8|nr:hypothetical protein [Paracoccus sp. (in: a-proteobacteria)]MDO5614129.1 hypothetical protein [Paracoccus sp. (in: a-proteobacteria)]